MTLTSPRVSNPSSWLRSSSIVRWISRSPPEVESYLGFPHGLNYVLENKKRERDDKPFGANSINLVNKHYTRCMFLSNAEELPDEFGPVAEVFLDQLRTDDAQKGGGRLVRDGFG